MQRWQGVVGSMQDPGIRSFNASFMTGLLSTNQTFVTKALTCAEVPQLNLCMCQENKPLNVGSLNRDVIWGVILF